MQYKVANGVHIPNLVAKKAQRVHLVGDRTEPHSPGVRSEQSAECEDGSASGEPSGV